MPPITVTQVWIRRYQPQPFTSRRSLLRQRPVAQITTGSPPVASYSAIVRISVISSGVSLIGLPCMLLDTAAFSTSTGRSAGVIP